MFLKRIRIAFCLLKEGNFSATNLHVCAQTDKQRLRKHFLSAKTIIHPHISKPSSTKQQR